MKHKEAWMLLAEEIDGEFIPKKGFKGNKVKIKYRNFDIVLDTYTVNTGNSSVTYTRMQSVFINKNDLIFNIHNKNFFFKIAKFFGLETIDLMDEELNKKIVVQGNDSYIIENMLEKEQIKELVLSSKNINIKIPKKKMKNSSRMYNESILLRTKTGVIKDIEILKGWFRLYEMMLDTFVEMDITEDVLTENEVRK